jgi:hypothetical protein
LEIFYKPKPPLQSENVEKNQTKLSLSKKGLKNTSETSKTKFSGLNNNNNNKKSAPETTARQQSVIKASLKVLPQKKFILQNRSTNLQPDWRQWVATPKLLWVWRSTSNRGWQVYLQDQVSSEGLLWLLQS